jgi:hypothetical protein
MDYVAVVAKFILSIWLWSITFGIVHCFLGTAMLLVILYASPSNSFKKSLTLSAGSYIKAQLFLTLAALLFGHHAYTIYYPITTITPEIIAIDAFYESFVLGATYTVLQMIFFIFTEPLSWSNISYYFTLLTFTNATISYVSYIGIRLAMWYLI